MFYALKGRLLYANMPPFGLQKWHIDNRLTVNALQTKDKKAYNTMPP